MHYTRICDAFPPPPNRSPPRVVNVIQNHPSKHANANKMRTGSVSCRRTTQTSKLSQCKATMVKYIINTLNRKNIIIEACIFVGIILLFSLLISINHRLRRLREGIEYGLYYMRL